MFIESPNSTLQYRPNPIEFYKLNPDAIIPGYATTGSSGLDVSSIEDITIPARGRAVVKTGLSLQYFDPRFELQVRPRSGLAAKHGITVLNTPGTIDADYVGFDENFEIRVILQNTSDTDYQVTKGSKIAQLVLAEVVKWLPGLINSECRVGGLGSTGQ